MLPTNPPPPESPEPMWDERLRRNPIVVVAAVAVTIMAGFAIVRSFFVDVLPWLLSFGGPVGQALQPVAEFVDQHSEVVVAAVTSVLIGGVSAVLATRAARGEARLTAERDQARQRVDRLQAEAARLSDRLRNLEAEAEASAFAAERRLAEIEGRVTVLGQSPIERDAPVSQAEPGVGDDA